jgi:hypothetical protein
VKTHLHVGGLVAAGFDQSGKYLITISHSGRGLFAVDGWKKIARDPAVVYPVNGTSVGIGPIDGQRIQVTELDEKTEKLQMFSPGGQIYLDYDSGMITVSATGA